MNLVTEPHFLAIMSANVAARALASQLPQNDLVIDLQEILRTQMDLCIHMINNKNFGIRKLKKFMNYTSDVAINTHEVDSMHDIETHSDNNGKL
jgi:hypothetical protein